MNRVVTLASTPAVTIERFDHPPGAAHLDPERECAPGHAVSIVESGSFRVRTRDAWRTITAGETFVTRPGLEFSCAHDHEHPNDACVSVSYTPEAMESLRGQGLRPSRALVHRASNRRAYLALSLRDCRSGDDARLEALAGALQWTLGQPPSPQPAFRADRLAWYARRVDAAVSQIEAEFAAPLSLTTLARTAGMSTFHFARVFAELHGVPPHRWLTRVRLDAARRRLREGASVTDTCFAVGFGSLSHFVTTYRRHFGERPSATARSTRR